MDSQFGNVSLERCFDPNDYASVEIAFDVQDFYAVSVPDEGLGGIHLVRKAVSSPYTKDYDASPLHHPSDWPRRFDMRNWGFLSVRTGSRPLGGAIVAWDTPGVSLLESRRDIAVLWDIRVARECRGKGVGSALLQSAEQWARLREVQRLKAETQNVNTGACRFYAKQGFVLGAIDKFAYIDFPDEAQLLWHKQL